MSTTVKFIAREGRTVCGGKITEFHFLQGEKVLEVCCTTMKIPFMLLSYTRNGKEDTVGWGHWGRISPETLQFSWILKVRMSLSGVGNRDF